MAFLFLHCLINKIIVYQIYMYNRYQNLLFFNKQGNPLDFKYDSDRKVWTGSMHLPEVPSNLIENETIYIAEKLYYITSNSLVYGLPHADLDTISRNFTAKLA